MHKSRSLASGVSGVSATSSARVSKRKRPSSHFHPFIIIAVVLSIGILLAGLIMTVIAYWPGQSSIGFNPMRIAGPCVLGAGALMLIIVIIIAVYTYKNNAAKRQGRGLYRNSLMARSYMSSRNTLNPPLTPTGVHRQQSNGYWDQPQLPLSYGYDPQGPVQQAHPVYKIETMPDPSNKPGSTSEVPGAIRIQSARSPSPLDVSRTSIEQGRQSPMAGTPDIGFGDRRSGYSSESDTEQGVNMDPTGQAYSNYPGYNYPTDYNAPIQPQGYNAPIQPQSYNAPIQPQGYDDEYPDPSQAQPKKKKKKKKPVDEEEDQPLGEIDPVTGERKKKKKKKKKVVEGEMGEDGSPALQRISIHAQPGTQVSITPRTAVESTF